MYTYTYWSYLDIDARMNLLYILIFITILHHTVLNVHIILFAILCVYTRSINNANPTFPANFNKALEEFDHDQVSRLGRSSAIIMTFLQVCGIYEIFVFWYIYYFYYAST